MILGSDGSGVIVEIGNEIKSFKIHDEVIVQPGTYDKDCIMVENGKENWRLKLGKTIGLRGILYSPEYNIIFVSTKKGVVAVDNN